MIDIENAIIKSQNMQDISDGGSKCFDFGDVVLVRYYSSIEYLKNGEHARGKSEEIMEAINEKAKKGVNTPMHLAIKRTVEGEQDVCYVLQKKCPGYNCEGKKKYGVSFDERCDSLKFILNIPFEHYQKLIKDGFDLFEMGYEAKNKNLFYDQETGFWYIDFLDNNKDYVFDPNDIKKVFEALKYRIPKPMQISSTMYYDDKKKLTDIQKQKEQILEYGIKAKTLMAIKSILPNFEKYEKFFLLKENDDYKKYLMDEDIVSSNLLTLNQDDYNVYNELYEIVMAVLIDKIVNKGYLFWNIQVNDIRNDSSLFDLQLFFEKSKYNKVKREEFDSEYSYESAVEGLYSEIMLNDIVNRLRQMDSNENIERFLAEADKKLNVQQKNIK